MLAWKAITFHSSNVNLPMQAAAAAAAACVEAPATPHPSPQHTPKQATPLPSPTPSPAKGSIKPVDSPALDKLRSLLKDHADSRAKAPASTAVGNKVLTCILLIGHLHASTIIMQSCDSQAL